jgi:hypothetical protein
MVYRGHIKNGVVIFDEPIALPEGARVTIEPEKVDAQGPTWGEVLKDFIGKAEGLPPDAAKNHDHYLYGAPKK